jgi:hypothetical protein
MKPTTAARTLHAALNALPIDRGNDGVRRRDAHHDYPVCATT